YNADSQPETMEELLPVAISKERGYITVNENIDPLDWEKEENPYLNGDSIFHRIVRHVDMGNVILLHDAGGDRSATVDATGKIIRHYQAKGYQFTTIADLLGKSRDDIMPEVPKGRGYALLQLNLYIFTILYYVGHFLFSLFLLFLVLGTLRIIALAVLALKQRKREKQLSVASAVRTDYPKVSIIVPAYNEEVNIVGTIMNLLQCDYPNFDVILVDDGSKDATLLRVREVFEQSAQVKIISKVNGGKASALNEGIRRSDAEYLICIDADTRLKSDA
ncbi:MAG TPA: glycosyl transferase family 2, partial [Chitinophagaceae bacterium]|nr:glycosyl transferase family 2 [Chitinophagaceae bacterium]